MVDIKTLLVEALKESFKANATLRAVEKKIASIIKDATFEKYKNKILVNDGMEYELVGVVTSIYSFSELNKQTVSIELGYFCRSNLPKLKRERLEECKQIYLKENYMPWNTYKVPLWKELRYEVELNEALSQGINLRIE